MNDFDFEKAIFCNKEPLEELDVVTSKVKVESSINKTKVAGTVLAFAGAFFVMGSPSQVVPEQVYLDYETPNVIQVEYSNALPDGIELSGYDFSLVNMRNKFISIESVIVHEDKISIITDADLRKRSNTLLWIIFNSRKKIKNNDGSILHKFKEIIEIDINAGPYAVGSAHLMGLEKPIVDNDVVVDLAKKYYQDIDSFRAMSAIVDSGARYSNLGQIKLNTKAEAENIIDNTTPDIFVELCKSVPTSTMMRGGKGYDGDDIFWIQRFLNVWQGANIRLSHNYDKELKTAIIQFQKKYDMKVDGAWGGVTSSTVRKLLRCVEPV